MSKPVDNDLSHKELWDDIYNQGVQAERARIIRLLVVSHDNGCADKVHEIGYCACELVAMIEKKEVK